MIRPTTRYEHLLTLLPDDKNASTWVHTQAGELPEEMLRDGQQLYVAHYVDQGTGPQKTWVPVIPAKSPAGALEPQRQAQPTSGFASADASSKTSPPALDMSALWPHSVGALAPQDEVASASFQESGENLLGMQQPLNLFPLLTADAGLNFTSQYGHDIAPDEGHDAYGSPLLRLEMPLFWPSYSPAVPQTHEGTSSDHMFARLDSPMPEAMVDMPILWPMVDDTLPAGHNANITPINLPAVTMLSPLATTASAVENIAQQHTLNLKDHDQLQATAPAKAKPTPVLLPAAENKTRRKVGPKVTRIEFAEIYVNAFTGAGVDHKSKGAIPQTDWEKQHTVSNTFLPRRITSKKEASASRHPGASAGAPMGVTKTSRLRKRVDLRTGLPTTANGPNTQASTTYYNR